MSGLLTALCTVSDEEMFRAVAMLHDSEGIEAEPSAAAGIVGAVRFSQAVTGGAVLTREQRQNATQIAWLTGGSAVPAEELRSYVATGRALLA